MKWRDVLGAELRRLTPAEWARFPVMKDAVIGQLTEELEHWAGPEDRVIGMVLMDNVDKDFSHVVLMRDKKGRYRAVDMGVSDLTLEIAREKLHEKMKDQLRTGEDIHDQGPAVDDEVQERVRGVADAWARGRRAKKGAN